MATTGKFKEKILSYLKKREDSISSILVEKFQKTGEIDPPTLEVFFTYNAIISDIKNDRLES